MLGPIVRLLIRNGITWSEFAELGKELYVEIARSDYGLQGRPTNSSRVALMTGLSRREVMRIKKVLLGSEPSSPVAGDRISRILSSWHLDPDFVGTDGRPLPLAEAGPDPSLTTLFRRYAGDTPHGALLKELRQLGLIVADGQRYCVTARSYVRNQSDPAMIRQAGVALHDHATTIVHNVDGERTSAPRFERMATIERFPEARVDEFQRLVARKGQAFLEEMDRWLAEHEEQGEAADSTVRTGVGVYVIREDSAKGTDNNNE